jgi:hypothetical protein
MINQEKYNLNYLQKEDTKWIVNAIMQKSSIKNEENQNLGMILIEHYKDFKLTPKKLYNLLLKCNLDEFDNCGWNLMIYVLVKNNTNHLLLNNKQIDSLLNVCDINQITPLSWTVFNYLIINNERENINLTNTQIQHIWQKCDLKNQEKTFQNFVQQSYDIQWQKISLLVNKQSEDNMYEKYIDYLLNDLSFQVNDKMKNWLIENNFGQVLQKIEAINIYKNLHHHLNQKDIYKKTKI